MLRAQILSSSNVRMAHCKSLIGYFPGRYSCSAAWREIKYSDVLSCLSVWCVSAESLSSQQDVRSGVGHKTALELVHLQQPEEINAFPSRRFTTEPSTRINRVCMLLLLIQKHHILWSQFHKYSHVIQHFSSGNIPTWNTWSTKDVITYSAAHRIMSHREYFQQRSASYLWN